MSPFKNPYKSMNELVESLVKENEELKLKLNNIEDFYQGRINRLIKRFEDEKSNEVKELRALGLSYRKIAERTSLGTTTICRIINGEYE